jgi:Uma2 family endonuclease
MESLKYLPRYTVSDYNLWEGEWELIDGHPVSMSPSPIRRHQRLAIVLASQIENKITTHKDTCGDCEVVFDLDWIVNDNTVLRPDIAIICDKSGDFITSPPVLVIEILSPSTALRDKHVKHEIYQKQGVKYYIIADPATTTFQSYTLVNGQYKSDSNSLYAIHDNCNISIDLARALEEIKG